MAIEPNPSVPSRPRREFRAATTFAIAVVFGLLALLAAGTASSTVPPVRGVVSLVGPIAFLVIEAGLWVGLAQRAPWATTVARPVLVLIAIGGAASFVMALGSNTFQIPIVPLLAVWALLAPPKIVGTPLGVKAAIVIAIAVVAAFWALPVEAVLRPGGPLVVDQAALAPTLAVTCQGEQGRQPTSVDIRYDWRWSRTEPWVAGQDAVIIEAFHIGEDGADYRLGDPDPLAAGISQADISIFAPIGYTFGVDLGTTGFAPQTIGFSLLGPSQSEAGSGTVDIRATYLHGPSGGSGTGGPRIWRVQTSAQCGW